MHFLRAMKWETLNSLEGGLMPQCGINRGCATIFTHVKIIFNISTNKTTDNYSNNRDFDYYKVPHLLQHASDSAADVEARK